MLSPPPSKRRTDGAAAAAADRAAMKPFILVVEDEPALVTLLRYNFEAAGYEVATAPDGDEALMAIAERRPDLVVLDWMLPSISGLEVCRQIRRKPETRDVPVIMLTARGEEADRVRGLDSGADDYVTKPFSPAELVARVRAVLRRSRPSTAEEALDYAGIHMDLAAHRVTRNGRPIHLGPTEFRLLRHFLEHPGRVFAREQLLDAVWGHDVYVEPRTVDVHIRRLRKAINGEGEPDVIRTVRSAGYALDVNEP
jgi:two-component system phosphate regulon response regulator PhoB